MAANVSKDTTSKQLINVEGIPKDTFKKQNINLFFGEVNAIEYCNTMYNFPDLDKLNEKIKEML